MAKTNLVIVESPAKAKTIGKYLGGSYQVKASMGHVRVTPRAVLRSMMGGGQAIMVDPVTRTLMGASDPRKDGMALGY
jgi:DNA topoisomerase-1